MDLIDIFSTFHPNAEEYTFQVHTFQVHMEHSLGQITYCVTNQASVNLRKLKLYQVSSLTTKVSDSISTTGKKLQKTQTHGD